MKKLEHPRDKRTWRTHYYGYPIAKAYSLILELLALCDRYELCHGSECSFPAYHHDPSTGNLHVDACTVEREIRVYKLFLQWMHLRL